MADGSSLWMLFSVLLVMPDPWAPREEFVDISSDEEEEEEENAVELDDSDDEDVWESESEVAINDRMLAEVWNDIIDEENHEAVGGEHIDLPNDDDAFWELFGGAVVRERPIQRDNILTIHGINDLPFPPHWEYDDNENHQRVENELEGEPANNQGNDFLARFMERRRIRANLVEEHNDLVIGENNWEDLEDDDFVQNEFARMDESLLRVPFNVRYENDEDLD